MQKEEKEISIDVDFMARPPTEDNHPIIGHASFQPMTIRTVEGKIATISQMPMKEANMALLTSLDNLPESLQGFILKLKPNTIALLTKKDSIYIEISLNILKSFTVFQSFLGCYHQLLAEFPALTNYIELLEATEHCTVIPPKGVQVPPDYPKEAWITRHFYVVVHVETMILDKLRITIAAKSENLDYAKSIDYFSKQGISDKEIQKMFQLDDRAFYRWKAKAKQVTDTVSVT